MPSLEKFKHKPWIIPAIGGVAILVVLLGWLAIDAMTPPTLTAKIPVGNELPREITREPITYMGIKGNRLQFETPDGERSYDAIAFRKNGPLPMPFFKHDIILTDYDKETITIETDF